MRGEKRENKRKETEYAHIVLKIKGLGYFTRGIV